MSGIDDLNRKITQLLKEPDSAKRYYAVGAILYRAKDWENAERFLGRAYELDPADIDILYHYAAVLYQRQDYQRAAALCRQGLKTAPNDRALLEKLGDSCYLLGVYEEAAKAYEHLHKISDGVVLP
ncbi:tetratricopeptide repeat protein [Oscillospiraceae bacterium LTW-04]|nr:tetratricopeptide repeat protein [Oscillospiraceae bacterium MB24-C1]